MATSGQDLDDTNSYYDKGGKIEIVHVNDKPHAVCPRCKRKVNLGRVGLPILFKTHYDSAKCKADQGRLEREEKGKSKSIRSFFTAGAKPTRIPSTIEAPSLIQGKTIKPAKLVNSGPPKTPTTINCETPTVLQRLQNLAQHLPETVPLGVETDCLAIFAHRPEEFDNPELDADELWEGLLNKFMKNALGWGAELEMKDMVRRGNMGIDGLQKFVSYYIKKRGVDGGLFEGKLGLLLAAGEEMQRLNQLDASIKNASSPGIEIIQNDSAGANATASPDPTQQAAAPVEVHEVDSEIEEIIIPRQGSSACGGYVLRFPSGTSPSSTYPFALHDSLLLPWEYSLKNNIMVLHARSCSRQIATTSRSSSCRPCERLKDNETLQNIIIRIEEGVSESAPFTYHGISGLQALLRRKNQQIEFYRLRGLNQARKLLTKASALTDQKRLVFAIASGKINRIDRLISIGLKQKKGVRGLLAACDAAAQGLYKPNGFTEEEDMRALLLWKLGGNRVAEINQRSQGAPSKTYLRTRSTVPILTPSPGQPTVNEVVQNVEATMQSIQEVLDEQRGGKVYHAVSMYDELATEKRIRWDPKTNMFLGVCREHAHKVSTQFVNEGDMEEMFAKLDEGEVHYAGEATISALGILCKDSRIYPARPVLISGDCKRETGEQHAHLIDTVLEGLASSSIKGKVRIVSLASDGESRRGSAFALRTFKYTLQPQSPIYNQLQPLRFMDLHVGDDDLTCDKDMKHIVKRCRNLCLRERGIVVDGFRVTPALIKEHMRSAGSTKEHINAAFNPNDLQDVKMAYDLLKDIWTLPALNDSESTEPSVRPGVLKAKKALFILGKLFFHLIFPYLCIDLSLSEQLEHLSAAAHLALILYQKAGKDFLPTNLYLDIMIMIKNVYFCVAKAKVDDPDSEFWIILLGTDRLEILFGILRTMIGNDANLDMYQLIARIAGTIEVANILAKYPDWDKGPRRLNLPVISCDTMKQIPDHADHVTPALWRGNVKVADVSLHTSWNRGRRMIETECQFLKDNLLALEKDPRPITILAPHGSLLVNKPLDSDDVDDSLEDKIDGAADPQAGNSTSEAAAMETRIEVEDALAEVCHPENSIQPANQTAFSKTIIINGSEVSKSRALSRFSKYRKHVSSTDRLRRVQAVERYTSTTKPGLSIADRHELDLEDEKDVIVLSDPIATLLRCQDQVWLCLGEVNGIKVDGQATEYISLDMLNEEAATISYQMLGLRPATSDDDPEARNDWRTYAIKEKTFSVPGYLIQPLNPVISTTHSRQPFYLLESNMLTTLTSSLFLALTSSESTMIPKITAMQEYPYREVSGKSCFVCESDQNLAAVGDNASDCPRCSPTIALDLKDGQRVLQHMGAHILHDGGVDRSVEICGLCLRPWPLCEFFLTKGAGAKGSTKVDKRLTRGCPLKDMKFSYRVAATPTHSSPCSNVPVKCPRCKSDKPAVWKYSLEQHFKIRHKEATLTDYEHLWKLEALEVEAMKSIYKKRGNIVKKRPRKKDVLELTISERHRGKMVATSSPGQENDEPDDHNASAPVASDSSDGSSSEPDDSTSSTSESETETLDDDDWTWRSHNYNFMEPVGELAPTTAGHGLNKKDGREGELARDGDNEEPPDEEQREAGSSTQPTRTADNTARVNPEPMATPGPVAVSQSGLCPSPENPPGTIIEDEDPAIGTTHTPEESSTVEECVRGKRKRVPTAKVQGLNVCLCGDVAAASTPETVKCKHAGCETKWVGSLH
ncbi:hypothetical protein CPC08DRAFT_792038 [Agrocybe pediades]|nr:hypothetical protein CPC08DRAFT_792038 [Agrocybe pediades]